MQQVHDTKIGAFIDALQKAQDKRRGDLSKDRYYAQRGPRYIRIVKDDGTEHGRSVFCFIDAANGDILKAAGWKAPAKHARGTIMTETHGIEFLGPYGPAYLR